MPSDLEWLSAKYERSEAAFMRSVATGCERAQLADLAEATAASAAELLTEARLGHATPAAAMRYQHAAKGRDQAIAAAMSRLVEGG